RTRGLPNAHEGAIHVPKESSDVEHDYADRVLSHAQRDRAGNLLSRSRSPGCSHRSALARLSVVFSYVPQSDSHACGYISCRCPRLHWIWRKLSTVGQRFRLFLRTVSDCDRNVHPRAPTAARSPRAPPGIPAVGPRGLVAAIVSRHGTATSSAGTTSFTGSSARTLRSTASPTTTRTGRYCSSAIPEGRHAHACTCRDRHRRFERHRIGHNPCASRARLSCRRQFALDQRPEGSATLRKPRARG